MNTSSSYSLFHPHLAPQPATECSSQPPSQRSTADTICSTARSELPGTTRRGSQELPGELPPNLPFVRRIQEDQHPASPDRSPLNQRRNLTRPGSAKVLPKSNSGVEEQVQESGTLKYSKSKSIASSPSSPEKQSPAKLPPRFPRSNSVTSESSPEKKSSRPRLSSSSRALSSSPSPVRSCPPKPASPSMSYSSSFGSSSGSASRSPSRSPLKVPVRTSGDSIEEALECDEEVESETESRTSKRSLGDKRKSWMAASSSRKTANSQFSTDADDKITKTKPRSRTASPKTKQSMVSLRPVPKVKPTKVKVVINEEKGRETKPKSPMVKRRPQSAPSKKPNRPPIEAKAALGEFSKSLKLLGLDIPSTRTEATKLTNQEVKVTTTEPSIRTRILKRSGSYADLTKNIKNDMKASDFEAVRNKVKDAVFEQWYFKKCAEEKERKLKQEEAEDIKNKEKEEKKKEVEELSKEEFEKWCRQKKKIFQKEKRKQEIIEKGKVTKVVNEEEVVRKNKEWLDSKKQGFQKKKEESDKKRVEQEAKQIAEDRRRTEAEKTFLVWKESKTKELRKRYQAEKKKQKEREEELLEKRRNADSVYTGWKNKKTKKPKEILEAKEEVDNKKPEEPTEDENNNRKLEEAKQAYESWLNLIEEREEENFLFEEERKRILMWKPPFYAGGKALF